MKNWEYINPSEGEHMYMDSFVIPKGANMDAAYAFINTIISKEYLTRNGKDTNWGLGYTNLDVKADAKTSGISDNLLKIAYPDDAVYKTAHYMSNIGDASLTYDEVWSDVKLKASSKLSSK
jgi:spermidine/putrescine-binding protein